MRHALPHPVPRVPPCVPFRGRLSRHRSRRARVPRGDEPRTGDVVLAVIGVALLAGLGLLAAAAGFAGAPLHP